MESRTRFHRNSLYIFFIFVFNLMMAFWLKHVVENYRKKCCVLTGLNVILKSHSSDLPSRSHCRSLVKVRIEAAVVFLLVATRHTAAAG
jgi:hypothetical protein